MMLSFFFSQRFNNVKERQMNLLKLDDKSRIMALKVAVAVGVAGTLTELYFLKKQTDTLLKVVEKHNKNVRKMKVASDIIQYFAEHGDPVLLHEVVEKYEFNWVVSDMEDPEK